MDPFLDEEEQGGGGFDPMSLLRAFWRRKMLFFVPFILCLSMAGIAVKTMAPIYASSGQVLINFEGLNSSILTDPSRRFGRGRGIDTMAYNQMNTLLTSPDFLDQIVMDLHLQDAARDDEEDGAGTPLSEEERIRRARSRLEEQVHLKRDGVRLFRLEVRDADPEAAFSLATFILERFVEEYRASQVASSNSTRDFMQKQLETYKQNLVDAEDALNAFQAGLASDALANNPINALNLATAQANLRVARERYEGTDAREMSLLGQNMRNLLGSVPAVSPYANDDVARTIVQEMEAVALELQLYKVGDTVARTREIRLGQLRVRLNTRIEEMVARQYSSLSFLNRNQVSHYIYFSLYRAGAKRVMDRLDAGIREFRDFTSRQPELSSRLAELQGDVNDSRAFISRIESEVTKQTMNLEASRSELGMQIKIRRKPLLSPRPVEPDTVRLLIMGVMLSLGIGLGLVSLAIFLDRSFSSVGDIERVLGIAVIGTLPVIEDNHFERKKKIRYLRWVTIILGIVAVGAVGFLVIYPRLG